jgi:hypothetical protein
LIYPKVCTPTGICRGNKYVVSAGLELHQALFAGVVHYGIFSKKSLIPRGTRFGPFHGKQVNTSEVKGNDDNSFMWEVRDDTFWVQFRICKSKSVADFPGG